MNENAKISLRKKLFGIFNNSNPSINSIVSSETQTRLNDLAKAIQKTKSNWLSFEDSRAFIFTILFTAFGKAVKAGLDPEKTHYHELINEEEEADRLIKIIDGIPYTLDVYFPLPYLNRDIDLDIRIGNIAELKKSRILDIQKPNGFNFEAQSYYFRATIQGYVGAFVHSIGFVEALGRFKTFIERGVSHGFLSIDKYPIYKEEITSVPSETLKAWFRQPNVMDQEPINIQLPIDISNLIKRVSFNKDRVKPSESIVTNQKHAEETIRSLATLWNSESHLANRLTAASEWHFDSLATEQETIKLIQVCIGLESIFGDDNSGDGLTESLSDRCSYLIAENHQQRKEIKNEFRELYRLRSKIVHGVSRNLTSEQQRYLSYGENLLKKSLNRELALCIAPSQG
ncbi:TPA: hypothetical protein L4I19_002434 [Pseudomonas aeruginosa]|nr:hypothetical protein [Pseudomonas aeruginosa]